MSAADTDAIKIFHGRASRDLCERICKYLDLPVGSGTTRMFPDGELLVKLDEDVRGRDCYVVQSTHDPVNAHLMELLIYIDTLKRASAGQITAVIPYFGYARQDRKDEGRTPITAKLVANLITAAGANRVLAMDLHAAQIQGFFDIPVDHLNAAPVLFDYFSKLRDESSGDVVMASPDVGNVKMAASFASKLGIDIAIVDKRRKSGSEVESAHLIGDVTGKDVFMVDDMISTAGTVANGTRMLKEHGAKSITVGCTHPVLVGLAMERINEAPIDRLVVTDTIPDGQRCDAIRDKLVVLSVADLIGEAIHRIHHNRSVSSLLQTGSGKR
ncbi:MAG: ribose-phosphate pyrophosphokinase [Planctomycetota bacterium]